MIACLFDIDGTLLASGGAGKAAMESALQEEFGISLKVHVPYSGRTDRAIARDLLRLHGIPDTLENWHRLRTAYLARLPQTLRSHQGHVLPGVQALLTELLGRPGVALGLLTGNIQAGAHTKLGHFQLIEHFSFGGYGDEHFDRDDVAREALRAVHGQLGPHVLPERVWVIGDTPLDVRCARAIGARVVAVATGVHTFEELSRTGPDLTLTDLSDASGFLDKLG